MSDTTVLLVDDSATIRRLVDSHLSQLGYRVILAENGTDGMRLIRDIRPDVILLDHQLPGTTGYEVCQELLESPELAQIPVVVSSTLRNKAYAEYTDLPNVVDMLPKPYTTELLTTIVSNALDTGSLVVESQSQGTAVPEVMQELGEADLSGSFENFEVREVLDFLNNGAKRGVLEVESERSRVWFYLDRGRIQAVTGTGIETTEVTDQLPEPLQRLAPVLNLTVSGRLSSQADGLVELMDNKVLDPRLLRTLLRHQAAILVRSCFQITPKAFRFEGGRLAPPLFRKLPLDVSLLALLVEGALRCDESQIPAEQPGTLYVRRPVRGQSLDRAGLSAAQLKVFTLLSQPLSADELADRLGWEADEARRVLHGFMLAGLVEAQSGQSNREVIILETVPDRAQELRNAFTDVSGGYVVQVAHSLLALQLLLKRSRPDALVVSLPPEGFEKQAQELSRLREGSLRQSKWIAMLPSHASEDDGMETDAIQPPFKVDSVLRPPCSASDILRRLDSLFDAQRGDPGEASSSEEAWETTSASV